MAVYESPFVSGEVKAEAVAMKERVEIASFIFVDFGGDLITVLQSPAIL